mmetsp:Transcript_41623/g.50646  ORF Transcript_41623/g.50646 Transcript_41623/m.50646 type:complete len:377 (+) Transcript_41623:13-1143(+)
MKTDESDDESSGELLAPFALSSAVAESVCSEMTPLTLKANNFLDAKETNQPSFMADSIILAAAKATEEENGVSESVSNSFDSIGALELDFSQLMKEADDTLRDSQSDLMQDNISSDRLTGQLEIGSMSTTTSTTAKTSNIKPKKALSFKESLAQEREGMSWERLGEDTFRVSVYISHTPVRNVMERASNPDLLKFWCDPVIASFVTKESGGLRDDEEVAYDGEWIEMAATLRPPLTGGVYNCCTTLKTYLGFRTHGTITLFIEKQRGTLALTIGPLGGFAEIIHNFSFVQDGRGVEVLNTVRVNRESVLDRTAQKCCLCPCMAFRKCVLPSLEAHMNQCVKSMEMLRELVEVGETAISGGQLADTGTTPLLGRNVI